MISWSLYHYEPNHVSSFALASRWNAGFKGQIPGCHARILVGEEVTFDYAMVVSQCLAQGGLCGALVRVRPIDIEDVMNHDRTCEVNMVTACLVVISLCSSTALGNPGQTVEAKGTLEPEEVVEIGSQVTGQIVRLGANPADRNKTVDFGTAVDEGTVLAQIDDTLYTARVAQGKARVASAEANVKLEGARLALAEREVRKVANQLAKKLVTEDEQDIAGVRCDVARARVAMAMAAVEEARAAAKEAEANLEFTIIRSPIKGIIIDRRVSAGQTVAAGQSGPGLFLVAKLKRLQVWASVKEADIASIHPGQQVQFTVDAFRERIFKGTVAQVRLNATMTQNVVTYTVVVNTDNSDGKLLPYLTANVQFLIGERP
jgi:HlyD family secretion protein